MHESPNIPDQGTEAVASGADVERQLTANRQARYEEKQRHEARVKELAGEADRLLEQRDMAMRGVDPDVLALAKSVIYVRGKVSESAGGAFEAALERIAAGGSQMLREYVGAKRYSGFHQRCDSEYGYGPKHGGIVFEVGLAPEIRRRACPPDEEPLTEEERDAALRWLHALRAEAEAAGWGPR